MLYGYIMHILALHALFFFCDWSFIHVTRMQKEDISKFMVVMYSLSQYTHSDT